MLRQHFWLQLWCSFQEATNQLLSLLSQIFHENIFALLGNVESPPSGLTQFLTTVGPLKMLKNASYFMWKALFVLKIFTFFSWIFGYSGKQLDKKAKINFKIYDVTDWGTNKYNTQSGSETLSFNKIWREEYFSTKVIQKMRQEDWFCTSLCSLIKLYIK